MILQVTNAAKALIAASGFAGLVNPRVDLITAMSVPINPDTVWGDLTRAAFTGYAGPLTPTISAVYVSHPSGLPAVDVSDTAFNGPTAGAGVDVIGLVLHDTTATPVVYAVGQFDAPLPLQVALDRVTVDESLLLDVGMTAAVSN